MSCSLCHGWTVTTCPGCGPGPDDDHLDDDYWEWLATQPPDVQRSQRAGPDWQGIHEDREEARAERRRAREER